MGNFPGYRPSSVPKSARDSAGRAVSGMKAGIAGITLNLILFALKLPMGLATASVSVTSDAFNSLSDMGSSLITVIGARLAGRRPDREHPFGHGRLEYVLALIISFFILLAGFELMKTSFSRIIRPETVRFHPLLPICLSLSVLIKLFMFYYNRRLGRLIRSQVLLAAASDSLSDAAATCAALLAAAAGRFVSWPVDAVAGLILSLLILYSGFRIARDTINLLLGGRPDPELVDAITRLVLQGEDILGIHDLIIHDYGPGRVMASVHAEVPSSCGIVRIHASVNSVEELVEKELGVPIVIHMDPVNRP